MLDIEQQTIAASQVPLNTLIPPTRMSLEDYHCKPGLSSTKIKLMLDHTPFAAMQLMLHPKPPTKAMREGTLLHLALLERSEFEAKVLLKPKIVGEGKMAKERALAEKYANHILIDDDEAEMLRRGVDAAMRHPLAHALITHPQAIKEHSLFFNDPLTHILCKVRPDIFIVTDRQLVIADLKKTKDASHVGFGNQARDLHYDVSAAFYIEALRKLYPNRMVTWYWIAVESDTEQCAVYEMTPESHKKGFARMQKGIDLYAQCKQESKWTSYQPDGKPQPIFVPKWA